MPYFDDRTYAVGRCVGDDQQLRNFADEFYTKCLNSRSYPDVILEAEKQAFRTDNRNEIIIMADATSIFRVHMEKAFDAALAKANTRESRFELICITLAAIYTYQPGDGRFQRYSVLCDKLMKEIDKYNEEFGSADLAFVKNFERNRDAEIYMERQKDEADFAERCRIREEKAKQEEAELQRRKELRLAEEKRIKEERRLERKARTDAWQAKVEEFKKLSLTDQLETIVSNREIPTAYDIDFGAVSGSDLKAVPGNILVRVITSFLNVKDPGWKELQNKARNILSERPC